MTTVILRFLFVLSWSVQLAMAAGFLFVLLMPTAPTGMLPESVSLWRPVHQPLVFVVFFICWMALTMGMMKAKGKLAGFISAAYAPWTAYVWTEILITFLWLSTVYQMTAYANRPAVAKLFFVLMMIGAVLVKLFWKQFRDLAVHSKALLLEGANLVLWRGLAQAVFIIGLAAVLYVPDMTAVVARDFLGQQFHHLDGSFVGPAYAASKGARLYIDQSSYYGLGIPIELSFIARFMGGFSYEHILIALMWAGILYYALLFVLLRRWFNSVLLAGACVLMAMRAQVFQTGVVPILWTTPQASVMRFWWDIAVFWMLFMHLKTLRWRYLFIAAAACGVSVWHMSSTGVSLAFAFGVYLAFMLAHPDFRKQIIACPCDWGRAAAVLLFIPVTAGILFWLSIGPALLSKTFVENVGEFMHFFLSSFGTAPYAMHLKNKNFMLLGMGLVYPLVYVLSMTAMGALCWFGKIRREYVLVVFWSVYGLGLYQYFVVVTSNYYASGLPFFLVLGAWIKWGLEHVSPTLRLKVTAVLFAICAYAMTTCHMFTGYPNMLNLSRSPMVDSKVAQLLDNRLYYFNQLFIQYPSVYKMPLNSLGQVEEDLRVERDFSSDHQLKTYYKKETDFKTDADLIRSLTGPQDKVALVSSFEILLLMQADRKPYFYFFPLINSRPMRMRIFVTTHLFTIPRLKKVIDQMEQDQVPYIFMERIFLNRDVPQPYWWDSVDMMNFLNYIWERYEPYKTGEYLVAMKRKVK